MVAPERISTMPCKFIFSQKRKTITKLTDKDGKILEVLQDFAREDFVNPFEELARMKLQAKRLIKEFEKEK